MYLIAVSKPNQKNRLTYENIKWRTGIYWFTLNQPAIYCVTGGLFCSSTQLSDLKTGHNHLVSMTCLDMIETWGYDHEPLPHSSRSDRVWAPIRDLAGSNSNSLVNLEWNRGMQRKSNLDTEERKKEHHFKKTILFIMSSRVDTDTYLRKLTHSNTTAYRSITNTGHQCKASLWLCTCW